MNAKGLISHFEFCSYVSGVSLLGVPAEIYTFGTQYGVVIIAEVMVCVLSAYMFMPVFYKLQLFSSFEVLSRALF